MTRRPLLKMRTDLLRWGFAVGKRDPELNTNYPGRFMVCEAPDDKVGPTKDGRNGPWTIVGDDLNALIDEAWRVWESDYA